ncbi:cytochrome c [Rhizobiales bacterium]|nr:cytochrome c [Hongsoonwoonella zoysiae]
MLLPAAVASLLFVIDPAAASSDDTLIKRGEYLINGPVACGNCHTLAGPDGPDFSRELAGGLVFDVEPFKAYAANITPDNGTGIGAWSDAELAKAIREGLRPDGTLIGPPMPIPFYRALSDQDLAAIVAYIRSVAPVKNEVPTSSYNIPLPPAYGPPIDSVSAPSPDDHLAYGEYLVTISHCMECHTPLKEDGHPDFERLGAGGNEFPGPWGVSVSRNITPDKETGLGEWSDEEIKTAIAKGVSRDGSHLLPPMGFGYYANITEPDLNAMVAYLRSIPPQTSEH